MRAGGVAGLFESAVPLAHPTSFCVTLPSQSQLHSVNCRSPSRWRQVGLGNMMWGCTERAVPSRTPRGGRTAWRTKGRRERRGGGGHTIDRTGKDQCLPAAVLAALGTGRHTRARGQVPHAQPSIAWRRGEAHPGREVPPPVFLVVRNTLIIPFLHSIDERVPPSPVSAAPQPPSQPHAQLSLSHALSSLAPIRTATVVCLHVRVCRPRLCGAQDVQTKQEAPAEPSEVHAVAGSDGPAVAVVYVPLARDCWHPDCPCPGSPVSCRAWQRPRVVTSLGLHSSTLPLSRIWKVISFLPGSEVHWTGGALEALPIVTLYG